LFCREVTTAERFSSTTEYADRRRSAYASAGQRISPRRSAYHGLPVSVCKRRSAYCGLIGTLFGIVVKFFLLHFLSEHMYIITTPTLIWFQHWKGAIMTTVLTTPIPDSTPAPSRFLTQLREAALRHGHLEQAADAMVAWTRRFILFHGTRHPQEMGRSEAAAYLEAGPCRPRMAPMERPRDRPALPG
jgi:hypothetical protein